MFRHEREIIFKKGTGVSVFSRINFFTFLLYVCWQEPNLLDEMNAISYTKDERSFEVACTYESLLLGGTHFEILAISISLTDSSGNLVT